MKRFTEKTIRIGNNTVLYILVSDIHTVLIYDVMRCMTDRNQTEGRDTHYGERQQTIDQSDRNHFDAGTARSHSAHRDRARRVSVEDARESGGDRQPD